MTGPSQLPPQAREGWLRNRIHDKWLRRAALMLRISRALAYLCVATSAAFALRWPPVSLAAATDGQRTLTISWAALMGVSSAVCAVGAITDRWVGEYVGLIPLSFVAAAFGVSALARSNVSWAGGAFLLGFFWLLLSRWQEVGLLRVEADRRARQRKTTEP